ncbi:acetyl-CoA acetyltransferase [Paenibacillus sp. 19GGS1-52]|uniref:acetyl-CoA acetyltransferase n=1 Tax=Paenibacillus sp. 19GGS1-52 TaxID=2758563 RepID=UPI001EFBEB46|nr:acetyl-CoA acetyltransferase [Paenibacillus sp. 19GGS1-52]ULO09617.1 acetyl-CoA acetyltransferase [Paenibacillus sp. 19GGS1-52]
MSTYYTGQPETVIYQADPAVIQHLHGVRESLHHSCKPYLNHKVKVQTVEGQVHEGVIAGVDNKHLYLSVTVTPEMARGYYNPYYKPYPTPYPGGPYPGSPYNNNVILPLVLFELLAISLI